MIKKINNEISDYFGTTVFHVEEDKVFGCDVRLVEDGMSGMSEMQPEEFRDAVAAYIFYMNRGINSIAYGGVFYSRRSILRAIFLPQRDAHKRGLGH